MCEGDTDRQTYRSGLPIQSTNLEVSPLSGPQSLLLRPNRLHRLQQEGQRTLGSSATGGYRCVGEIRSAITSTSAVRCVLSPSRAAVLGTENVMHGSSRIHLRAGDVFHVDHVVASSLPAVALALRGEGFQHLLRPRVQVHLVDSDCELRVCHLDGVPRLKYSVRCEVRRRCTVYGVRCA